MRSRFIKLLKILIKIAIMGLVITGIILINRKYMSNADGSEQRVSKNITSEFTRLNDLVGQVSESYNSIT